MCTQFQELGQLWQIAASNQRKPKAIYSLKSHPTVGRRIQWTVNLWCLPRIRNILPKAKSQRWPDQGEPYPILEFEIHSFGLFVDLTWPLLEQQFSLVLTAWVSADTSSFRHWVRRTPIAFLTICWHTLHRPLHHPITTACWTLEGRKRKTSADVIFNRGVSRNVMSTA